ncbi:MULTISPECIES: hypothetical protein [unclassified Roseitalea]|uniref:hypothetical protein n=1 Tax=unclassified Roseitalea TaxID=2639107 RepID=UPI00273E7485|nr:MULTISPECIES: hypothetical protein [unclassified Roseitalea]
MRRINTATSDELVKAIRDRYATSGHTDNSRIRGKFVAVSGFHRKHAMRLPWSGFRKAREGAGI